MKFGMFYQSVISDWNHGNAHFLRGVMRSLQATGHEAVCYEQVDNWSLGNLLGEWPDAVDRFRNQFPDLLFERYSVDGSLDQWLCDRLRRLDAVIVHEWNDPAVIKRIGALARQLGVRSLFHDTHYRVILDDAYRQQLGLDCFDEILAFSPSIADRYRFLGYRNVHVLHEAADTTVFYPREMPKVDDVVYVGNYGDGDRSKEIEEYLFRPRRQLPGHQFAIYGVRYPESVLARMRNGLRVDFRGRIANTDVPTAYSAARVVLHIPRRQYVELLPGTPTIRVFEALATGACLISLPWPDTDALFQSGHDYLVAETPDRMRELIAWLCRDDETRERIGRQGRETILARHTCDHRAAQLLDLLR